MNKTADSVDNALATGASMAGVESHNELRFHAGQLAFLAEKGNLQSYAAKVQELWANPETRMAGNAALGAYFDGISGTQNIADVAQSALNAQLKAEQEIGAKHGDYDKEINVKENVEGHFANPINPVKVQSDLTQQFNDSPLMQKVSHNISNAQTNIEQEKQAMSEQVSGSLKEKHETTNTTAAGLIAKDIAADMGDDAKAFQESIEKGDYKAALGTAKDWVTPGGTSSMFKTPEPTTSEEQSVTDKAKDFLGDLAQGVGETFFGIKPAYAGEMLPEHFQQTNKEQTENKPFNPLDFDPKQDAWSRTHGAYEQVKEQTLDKERQEEKKSDWDYRVGDISEKYETAHSTIKCDSDRNCLTGQDDSQNSSQNARDLSSFDKQANKPLSGSLKDDKLAEVENKDARKEPQNEQEKPAKPHNTRQPEHLSQENHHKNQYDNLKPPKYLQQPTPKSDNISGNLNEPVAHQFIGVRRISYREIEGRKFDCSNPIERHESLKASPFCSELKNAEKLIAKEFDNYKKIWKYTPASEQNFLNQRDGFKKENYHYSMGQCYKNQEIDLQYLLTGWNLESQYPTSARHMYVGYSALGRGGANLIKRGKYITGINDMPNVRGLEMGILAAKNYGYTGFGKYVKDLCGEEK